MENRTVAQFGDLISHQIGRKMTIAARDRSNRPEW